MSKKLKLIILVAVLAVLAGAFFIVKNLPEKEENITDTNERVQLTNYDIESVEKMVLKSDERTLTVEKQEDGYSVETEIDIIIDQDAVKDIARSFAKLQAEKIIEESPEDLSVYGLDNPQQKAYGVLEDGTEIECYLGNEAPSGDSYYLMMKDDPKVYLVWMNHGNHFSYTISDLREKEIGSIDGQKFRYIKIAKKDQETIEIKHKDDIDSLGTEINTIGVFKMIQPYKGYLDVSSEDLEKVLEKVTAFKIEDFVEDNPKDLSKYDLDEPLMDIELYDGETRIHLLIGSDADDNTVYVKKANDNTVFTVKKSSFEFANISSFQLVDKFVCLVNIDVVDKIKIESATKDHLITFSRKIEKAEKEDEEDKTITTYKLDGKEIEEDTFKKMYQEIIGLLVDAELAEQVDGESEISIEYTLNNTDEIVRVEFINYDEDFYAVKKDEVTQFIISKQYLDKMLDKISKTYSGEFKAE